MTQEEFYSKHNELSKQLLELVSSEEEIKQKIKNQTAEIKTLCESYVLSSDNFPYKLNTKYRVLKKRYVNPRIVTEYYEGILTEVKYYDIDRYVLVFTFDSINWAETEYVNNYGKLIDTHNIDYAISEVLDDDKLVTIRTNIS